MLLTVVLAWLGQLTPLTTDSLTLTRALALAREQSPLLAAASAVVREAEARGSVARAARAPRLSADALYLRYQDPPALGSGPVAFAPFADNNYLLQLRLAQPLFTGGGIAGAVRTAGHALEAADASRDQAEVELTAAVAHAYDDALLAQALRDVTAQGVAVLEEAVRVAQEHYAAGTVARLDVLRAETRLSSARAALRAQEVAIVSSGERLAALIGLDPSHALPLAGALEYTDRAVSLEPLAARLTTRPDIRALRANAAARRAGAAAARAAQWPSVSAYVSVLSTRPELVTGRARFGTELLGGFSLTWPFFDAGASAAGARAERAAAEQASAQADAALDQAMAVLRASARDLERAAEDVREGRANVTRAERALEIAQERYRDGIGIQLEVLEAEADLTQARADLLRAIHAHRAAAIELKRATGLPADAELSSPGGGGS